MTTVLYLNTADDVSAEAFESAHDAIIFAENIRRVINVDVHVWSTTGAVA